VLVTGAGGFVGGRVVEVLHASGRAQVRAAVRRWAGAARIGRFPIEIVRCDVGNPTELERAMVGVAAVVHCAIGSRDVNVEGTRNVLEAARQSGVRRVVHLSTIAVYGDASGEIDETNPCRRTGDPYGDSKIEAEQVCQEYTARAVPVVILRPTIVYGPFSANWTIEFAERFRSGTWHLPERYGEGTCNLVYVDDLVAAVLLALTCEEAVGETFNVNGEERPTWNEYFRSLNASLGFAPLREPDLAQGLLRTGLLMPVRKTAKLFLKHFQPQIRALYRRSDLAQRLMRSAERSIRNTPSTAEFRLYSHRAFYRTEKAARILGYRPAFKMTEGVALSAAWLRHHRYA